MRILVTGGTGLVGFNLTSYLYNEGHDLVITGHDAETKLSNFKGIYLQPSFIGLDWDRIGKVDVVFHQAAINDTTLLDKKEMFRVNVDSSVALFKYAIENGCKKIVYASSTAVYGNEKAPYVEGITKLNPLNPYAESKVELEKEAMKFAKEYPDIVFVGLRYCNIYGPGEQHKGKRATMIYQLAQQMLHGDPKIFFDGEQKRDYIYVKDVVKANIFASKAKETCIVNCGTGKATSFNEIIRILNSVLKLDRKPIYIENPFQERYQNYTECGMKLAKEKIDFVPDFDIATGIKDYYDSGYLVSNFR